MVERDEKKNLPGLNFVRVFIELENPRLWIKEIAINGLGSCPDFSKQIHELTLDRLSELTWFKSLPT